MVLLVATSGIAGTVGTLVQPSLDTNSCLISAEIMPMSEPNILHLLESGELPITKQLTHEAVVEEFGTSYNQGRSR